MGNIKWFNVDYLLAMKDAEGKTPGVYIATSRVRGTGKTYSVASKVIKVYLEKQRQFILLTRTKGKLGKLAEGMFLPILRDKYPGYTISETVQQHGVYSEIWLCPPLLDEEDTEKDLRILIGYGVPLSAYSSIKEISGRFIAVDYVWMDEFLPEDPHEYLTGEIDKFLSILGSVGRGSDGGPRDLTVILTSNTVTMFNPYFDALGLIGEIQADTKKYRGRGVVFMMYENDNLAKKHADVNFNRAFTKNKANDYSGDVWFRDANAGISKPDGWGFSQYRCTVLSENVGYGVRYYPQVGLWYVDKTTDETTLRVFRLTDLDSLEYPKLNTSPIGKQILDACKTGRIRFRNATIRNLFFKNVGY